MRIKNLLKKFVPLFVLIISSNVINSQNGGNYTNGVMIAPPNATPTSGSINFVTPCGEFKIDEGKVWVKLDLGENYEFGSNTAGIVFDIQADVDLTLLTSGGSNPTISFSVVLNNNKPESIIYLNLKEYIDDTNATTGLSYLNENITGVRATVNSAIDNEGNINIQNDLNIGLYYSINYGINVSSNTVTLSSTTLHPDNKVVTFEWVDTCVSPNYQFQLLRLFNKDKSLTADERIISTNIDWSKALSFQTDDSETRLDLTIGEGQGYYIWRVRPVGTFYENGVGNDLNWGNWNTTVFDENTMHNFDASTISNVDVFFFEDADDNRNYQYSRVFTERNKISEQTTYATTLNQVKQIQKYFPSKDYKVITQTVLDKSGRPTLTTLPVPVQGEKISAYKNKFVTTNNGELYKAKHFDEESNFKSPSIIDATGAYSYYSNANSDGRVADAEGYPYTRVLFSHDGTDRVIEQSGVGSTHMIGEQENGQGRTTKTLYTTSGNKELLFLFGDEAPDHENVAKIITVDPNGTRSVAYITKEGKTIATGITFSEDSDVLDQIEVEENPEPEIDFITNNMTTNNGFIASKRIVVLLDGVEIMLNYSIAKPVLEGLCNNLEIEMDYKIKIQVFNVDTGEVVQEFVEESIAAFDTDPDAEVVNIDFGTITLDSGTYYVQKELIPAENINAELVNADENIRRIINPYFNWLTRQLDEVDCEAEMQVLYEDLFFYGKTIHNNGITDVLNFPSGINVSFLRKDTSEDPDAPDEFLDYYEGREDQYSLTIFYYDENGDVQQIDYDTTTELGSIVPIEAFFKTPCCEFPMPIVFQPPFRVPTPEALLNYKNSTVYDSQLNNSLDYNNVANNPIQPNNFQLTETENNLSFDSNNNITNGDAYPLDFEGYAISMLYECHQAANPDYTIQEASAAIYKYMRGWHKPGLFNQMVYHMATDNYGEAGCDGRVDLDENGILDYLEDGSNQDPPDGSSVNQGTGYHQCDIVEAPVKLPGAQYAIQDIVDCWQPLVIEMVNKLCVEMYELDTQSVKDKISENVDDQDEDINDSHFRKNIKNWFIRWISRRKLNRRIRRQGTGASASPAEDALNEKDNVVNLFLACTGYSFADIISGPYNPSDPDTPKNNFTEFDSEFDNDISNGEYNLYRLGNGTNWNYFTLHPEDDGDYITPPAEGQPDPEVDIIKNLFPAIKDPVYAFKYYEYIEGTYEVLEKQTCFRNPNICIDPVTGEYVPCCGGTVEDPDLCNFCGIGYITCPYTKSGWNCDQRYTFFELIKNYQGDAIGESVPITCENYYEATEYVMNPDFGKEDDPDSGDSFVLEYDPNLNLTSRDLFSDLEYLSRNLWDGGTIINPAFETLTAATLTDIEGNTATTGISIIEHEAYQLAQECDGNCDQRRNEFRNKLIESFESRCYVIGECKVDPNDNIVPEEDLEALLDKIVAQCKLQCAITTFTCSDEPCRLLSKPIDEFGQTIEESFDFNVSYIDYGVSGPIVAGLSGREAQTLIILDPTTGQLLSTGETVSITNVSSSALPFEKYSYASNPSIWDLRKSLTYAEYSRWIQALQWEIDLDLPSKCDEFGVYNPNLTYDINALPQEPVYIQNENGEWVVQNFEIQNMPYVTRDNPAGPGDTFVERDQYIQQSNTPVTGDDAIFREGATSPKIGIEHRVEN